MRIDIFHVGVVSTNAYLVEDEGKLYLIDPGDNARMILDRIGERKLSYIFLTHGHFDHLLAADEIRKATGAYLVASKHARLDDEVSCGFASFGMHGFKPMQADISVSEGDEIDGFKFMETPGHTPCSLCIVKGDTMFSGDTLFAGSCGRCDLPGGDYNKMMSSLNRLSQMEGELKVYPGHGNATTIEREKMTNPYMCEAMR